MTELVTIFGGSGFVGRYIVQRMARAGWRVRVAVRRPERAGFVRTYGFVGQVEPVAANIRDDASVARALERADAAVNCVGILAESGRQRFAALQAEGAGRIARAAAEARAARMVHISAIGADPRSASGYARSKAEGEALVRAAFPGAVILRPSIVFGPEDEFFNRFAAMARLSPAIPLFGAETKFQPVWVEDVAAAAEKAVLGQVAPGIYELGGPEVLSFRGLMRRMLEVIRRDRAIIGFPNALGWPMAAGFDLLQAVSFGLIPNGLLTRDQLRQLARDNVVAPGARTLADLGIEPTAMAAVLESYLYAYRPGGQYSATRASAGNLR
jgi:uncharacterized protein YbjT (DUF2867 family)